MGLEGERERESVKADHSRAEEGSGGPRARGSLDDPHMPGGKGRERLYLHSHPRQGRKEERRPCERNKHDFQVCLERSKTKRQKRFSSFGPEHDLVVVLAGSATVSAV